MYFLFDDKMYSINPEWVSFDGGDYQDIYVSFIPNFMSDNDTMCFSLRDKAYFSDNPKGVPLVRWFSCT